MLIGGGGEQKTLRTVARYADIWNWVGLADLDRMRRKHAVFEQRCEEEGRDPASIVKSAFLSPVVRDTEAEALAFFRTQMTANRLDDRVLDDADIYPVAQDRLIELMVAWKEIGVTSFIVETAAPSAKAGCRSTRARNARFDGTPSSAVRSSASASRSSASARVAPCAISFASIES